MTSRPPTRATESYNGGRAPSSTVHHPTITTPTSAGNGLPHPPPPPLHTFAPPGPHGNAPAAHHTPTKRVTIAPHALIDPPGKTGSLVRAVPTRIGGGGGTGNGEPHRTYGYLPARGDPLQHRDPLLSGYVSGGERGYHTLNPRHQNATGNYAGTGNGGTGSGAAHGRLVHQSSDTTHGGCISHPLQQGVPHPLSQHHHHHPQHHHTLPHPPHRASSLPHQPLSSASQGSQGSHGGADSSDSNPVQNSYALNLADGSGGSTERVCKDVVV